MPGLVNSSAGIPNCMVGPLRVSAKQRVDFVVSTRHLNARTRRAGVEQRAHRVRRTPRRPIRIHASYEMRLVHGHRSNRLAIVGGPRGNQAVEAAKVERYAARGKRCQDVAAPVLRSSLNVRLRRFSAPLSSRTFITMLS